MQYTAASLNDLSASTISNLSYSDFKSIVEQYPNVILNVGGIGCWRVDQFDALSAEALGAFPLLTGQYFQAPVEVLGRLMNSSKIPSGNYRRKH